MRTKAFLSDSIRATWGSFHAPGRVLPQKSSISLSRRSLSTTGNDQSVAYPSNQSIESLILTSALPFVPRTGFSMESLMAGIKSTPQLDELSIQPHTLAGLFPSGVMCYGQKSRNPIGPIKALAGHWLEEGNLRTKLELLNEGMTLEKHGIDGLIRGFTSRLQYNRSIDRDYLLEGLILTATPAEPFFGIPFSSFELPHILPYGSHALDVSEAVLAGLKDYSSSLEWRLRVIRMAGVYGAIELSTLMPSGPAEPTWIIEDRLRSLLMASESSSTKIGETFEFVNYVNRSTRAIANSLGLP